MPAKGFKAITVKDDLYYQLQRQANDDNLSLNDYLFALINKRVSGRGGSNPPVGAIETFGKVSSKPHHSDLERINFRTRYSTNTVKDYEAIKNFQRFCLIDLRLSMDSAVHYSNTIFRALNFIDKPINSVKKDDLRSFLALFSNNHTYRNNLKGLKIFFRDYLDRPEMVDTFRFPRYEIQPRFMPSKKQLLEFFDCFTRDYEQVLFLLYASSGLRRSEVLDLRINQLDLENRAIIPNHATTQKKSWISFYNSECESYLKNYLQHNSVPGPSDGKIFRLSSEKKYLLFHEARLKTGLDLLPQTLRFWFSNEMGRLNVPDRFIDAFQGRTPRSILARHYSDYSIDNLKVIYNKAGLNVLSP